MISISNFAFELLGLLHDVITPKLVSYRNVGNKDGYLLHMMDWIMCVSALHEDNVICKYIHA